jgi:hypothetical protein
MRKLAILTCVMLVGAAPPPKAASPVDAKLRAIVQPVSEQQLRHTIETLVSFGTRHTLSSQTDPKRGIGAALNWAHDEFGRYSAACGGCLTIVKPGQQFTGKRIPSPTWVYDMVAIQRGTERPNDVVIIQGHIDSRVSDVMNFTSDAPGANDDGSGVAAVMEAARVLSKHKFPARSSMPRCRGRSRGSTAARCWQTMPRRRAGTSSPCSTTTSSAAPAGRTVCAIPPMRGCCRKGRARRGRLS